MSSKAVSLPGPKQTVLFSREASDLARFRVVISYLKFRVVSDISIQKQTSPFLKKMTNLMLDRLSDWARSTHSKLTDFMSVPSYRILRKGC